VGLCIPLSLLGNSPVNTFPRQQRIVGSIVFYVVCFVPKENRRLVLPRTSCYMNCQIDHNHFCFRIFRFTAHVIISARSTLNNLYSYIEYVHVQSVMNRMSVICNILSSNLGRLY
jgi:hypothetical protein